jgi:Holliday junction resolvasome RuvABC endonuclease subunit
VSTPRVYGLDLSLTSTGIASNAGWADVIRPAAKLRGHERLAFLRTEILDRSAGADLIAVEGPAFGAKGSAYHQLAGMWWLITHALWRRNDRVAIVPPSNVKRYATGKGNANKDDIMREVSRRFDWFQGGNDSADALILASLAADHLGVPMVVMPQTHRTALSGVEWPAALDAAIEVAA